MSLWKIAWRSIQQRTLASSLTAVSMALGVALVVAVLVIHSVVYQSFNRGRGGYDLVVGAPKGSRLELVLNAVYYMGQSAEPLSYEYYKKLVQGRAADGVETAVPICLGDSYEDFRVVGTTTDMLDEIKYLGTETFEFAQGRNFKPENYFEAVFGATAARKTGMQIGKEFRPQHDVGHVEKHQHKPFTVVGILQPTGTPADRAIFVNIEGFFRQPGHVHDDDDEDEQPAKDAKAGVDAKIAKKEAAHAHDPNAPIPDNLKKVTAILVCLDAKQMGTTTRAAAQQINSSNEAQAALPGVEIDNLFRGVVGDIQVVLLLFAVMIVVVAGIGIMVSIYNSMSDRRHEISIMRALGASRGTIMAVILLESILLSLGGGALGCSSATASSP